MRELSQKESKGQEKDIWVWNRDEFGTYTIRSTY